MIDCPVCRSGDVDHARSLIEEYDRLADSASPPSTSRDSEVREALRAMVEHADAIRVLNVACDAQCPVVEGARAALGALIESGEPATNGGRPTVSESESVRALSEAEWPHVKSWARKEPLTGEVTAWYCPLCKEPWPCASQRTLDAYRSGALIESGEPASEPESWSAWLIERGQPEGHVPPLYYAGNLMADPEARWTDNPWEALQIPDRAEAERIMAGNRITVGRPVAHGFTCSHVESRCTFCRRIVAASLPAPALPGEPEASAVPTEGFSGLRRHVHEGEWCGACVQHGLHLTPASAVPEPTDPRYAAAPLTIDEAAFLEAFWQDQSTPVIRRLHPEYRKRSDERARDILARLAATPPGPHTEETR
jgi:hypothetical protein